MVKITPRITTKEIKQFKQNYILPAKLRKRKYKYGCSMIKYSSWATDTEEAPIINLPTMIYVYDGNERNKESVQQRYLVHLVLFNLPLKVLSVNWEI